MFRRTIVGISVEDVEKRRLPSKHYVYVIYVTWNDGALNVIYRRYSRFFELQSKLLDKYPEEAGTNDPSRRIIPFLPGKILFGRSHIREVALKRLESINQYCKTLVKLPTQISECDEVLAFFETAPDDLLEHSKTIERKPSKHKVKAISHPLLLDQYVAVAEYTKQGRNELSLRTGCRVEVVEKTELGWWFVSTDEGQGWVPSSHLEKEDGSQEDRVVHEADPGEEERFVVVETYIPMAADEIRIDKGGFVQVLERNLDGWWLVRYQGNEGRVPATNLNKMNTLKMNRIAGHVGIPPVEVIPNLMSISNINRQKIDKLVSDSSTDEDRGNTQVSNQQSPTRPLIDLNFDTDSSNQVDKNVQRSTDENFNPLLRSSRRKAPPPRRNSVSVVAPPRPAPPQVEPVYVAIADLQISVEDGVSLRQGEVVSVLEKTETGWWYVSAGQSRGWAPVSYITKRHQPKKSSQSPSPRPPRPPVPSGNKTSGTESSTSAVSKDAPASLSNLANILKNNQLTNKSKTGLNRSDSNSGQKSGQPRPALPLPTLNSSVSSESDNRNVPAQRQTSTDSTDEQMYQNVEDSEITNSIERYVAAYPFEGMEVGEVRLGVGDLVDVMGKNVSGWWYVKVLQGIGVGEGWVPSSYLKPSEEEKAEGATGFSPRIDRVDSIYEEVKHYGYDEDDASTEWSDTPTSSSVDLPAWSLVKTTATVEHIPESEPVDSQEATPDSLQPSDLEEAASKNQFDKARSLEDVARLDEYVKSSFKGPRPVLPTKKSKDAENSQRQETNSHSGSVLPPCAQITGPSAFGVSLKPTGSNVSQRITSAETVSPKPVLPAKKPTVSTYKPALPLDKPAPSGKPVIATLKPTVEAKPEAGGKPLIPGNKPSPSQNKPLPPATRPPVSANKPALGLAKPQIKSTKPSPPGNKPMESRTKPKVQSKDFQIAGDVNRTKFGSNQLVKSGGIKSSQVKKNGNGGKVDNNMPSKVQNLAKLFNQT